LINNLIHWAKEMQKAVTALYGLTLMFFTTNRTYRPSRVSEEAILNAFYESDEEEEDDNEEVEENSGDEEPTPAELLARATAVAAKAAAKVKAREARIKKDEKILNIVSEGTHEARR
jgi:hypothetical protein